MVLGNQRQSNQQPIPITTPSLLRLKGKPLNKGAQISQVVISFDAEGKSLKKPVAILALLFAGFGVMLIALSMRV